ncbi:venom metalloproteinase antarease TserMP_A-like [Amblyomma americanum]
MITVVLLCRLLTLINAEKELLVYPRFLEERSTGGKMVLLLGSDITLNLERSSVLADELLLSTVTGNGHRLEAIDTSSIRENLYHDACQQSSLYILHEDGGMQVEGIINSNLRIKPLLERERSSQGQILHSVYEVQEIMEDLEEMSFDSLRPVERELSEGPEQLYAARSLPQTNNGKFVVELHVISDREHHKHFKDEYELIAYLAVMTNAVNLRYLDMQNPNISFKLVGVTQRKTRSSVSVMVVKLCFAKEFEAPRPPGYPYDPTHSLNVHVVLAHDVCGLADGVASRGAVCTAQRVALGEDIAKAYRGVRTMAHELAHSLGAHHDEKGKGPCSWSHGFLMSYQQGGTNKYRLSPCSEAQIRSVVKNLHPNCLAESATTDNMVKHKKVPGQMITETEYCNLILKHIGYEKNVYAEKTPDLNKKCRIRCLSEKDSRRFSREVNMLEGMKCDGEHTCRRGVCADHKWDP